MSAQLAIDLAEKSGVDLFITPSGKIKYKGAQPFVDKLLPLIKKHKAEIVQLLTKPDHKKIILVEPALLPCPLCKGHNFIHGTKGGYFCKDCQPGHHGEPVKAGGQRLETALKGNDPGWKTPENIHRSPAGTKRGKESSFLVAHIWISQHRFELLGFGWKPSELYRGNKSRGIAWLSIWATPGLYMSLTKNGAIVFNFTTPTGNQITQTAFHPGSFDGKDNLPVCNDEMIPANGETA